MANAASGEAAVIEQEVCRSGCSMMYVAVHGIAVGALTGLVGVACTQVAHRISGEALKKGFAIFLMLVASYILVNQTV